MRRFDEIADCCERFQKYHPYYHATRHRFITSMIPTGRRVLDFGCGFGDLLSAVKPSYGLGVDTSEHMLARARQRHPHLTFLRQDLVEKGLDESFDYVVDYLSDVGCYLDALRELCHENTRLVCVNFNPLWSWFILTSSRLGWRSPDMPERNFLTLLDLRNLMQVHGFEVVDDGLRILLPKRVPVISACLNAVVPRLPIARHLCLQQYHVARLAIPRDRPMSCSVVIPCYNEEGNIRECIARVPQMGMRTEIVVVDDGSCDQTHAIVEEVAEHDPRVRLLRQPHNRGKGLAVRAGFDAATGDVMMILDADMTVAPEELVKFFSVLREGRAEFVNGTRMVYPMEDQAMRMLNFLGNKLFGITLSLIVSQRNTDVLCGTKAFLRRDYAAFELKGRSWGDFDLLFAAARLRLKVVEMPIHYEERAKGTSKMRPFRHGWELLKNCYVGLKEVP
jgi:SAM-dependent methyltransferase